MLLNLSTEEYIILCVYSGTFDIGIRQIVGVTGNAT